MKGEGWYGRREILLSSVLEIGKTRQEEECLLSPDPNCKRGGVVQEEEDSTLLYWTLEKQGRRKNIYYLLNKFIKGEGL